MTTKYIIIDNHIPIIFPNYIEHCLMAHMCKERGEVTSAGFVDMGYEDHGTDVELFMTAHGESISLGIEFKPEEDSKILTRMFRGY